METFKKLYDNGEMYNEVVEKLTSIWPWDNIDNGKIEGSTRSYTNFHIGNAYLQVAEGGTSNLPSLISVWFNNKADSSIYSTSANLSLNWFSYYKTSKTLLIHTYSTNNASDTLSYNSGAIIMIGSATNMLTQSKENVISIFTNPNINTDSISTYNKIFIASADMISYSDITFGPILYDSNVGLTMLTPANTKYSQVIMDDVYIVNRCNLTTPSIGECILNSKKYFMCFHIWIPYE